MNQSMKIKVSLKIWFLLPLCANPCLDNHFCAFRIAGVLSLKEISVKCMKMRTLISFALESYSPFHLNGSILIFYRDQELNFAVVTQPAVKCLLACVLEQKELGE